MKPETLHALKETAENLQKNFFDEAIRLANSGAYEEDKDPACMIIKCTLENLADRYYAGDPKAYKNLRKF